MILALNLNCSLDKIYTVPSLEHGGVVRAQRTQNTAGGKGLHIANICQILQEPYIATGFLGGHTGAWIDDILEQRKIVRDFVHIEGETRSCINIGTPDGKQTEVLEAGPEVTEREKRAFIQKFTELLQQVDIVTGSGSLPKGLGKNFYGQLIEITRKAGKVFLLDTSGETLLASLPYKPFMIKPNRDEIEAITGRRITAISDAVEEAKRFMAEGIELPIISLGSEGSVAGFKGKIYRAQPPRYKAVNAVGSGDSFVAGIAIGLSRGLSIEDTLRLGSACGTANVLEAESGWVDPQKVKEISQKVQLTQLA